jgi:hypothetical protein
MQDAGSFDEFHRDTSARHREVMALPSADRLADHLAETPAGGHSEGSDR